MAAVEALFARYGVGVRAAEDSRTAIDHPGLRLPQARIGARAAARGLRHPEARRREIAPRARNELLQGARVIVRRGYPRVRFPLVPQEVRDAVTRRAQCGKPGLQPRRKLAVPLRNAAAAERRRRQDDVIELAAQEAAGQHPDAAAGAVCAEQRLLRGEAAAAEEVEHVRLAPVAQP